MISLGSSFLRGTFLGRGSFLRVLSWAAFFLGPFTVTEGHGGLT